MTGMYTVSINVQLTYTTTETAPTQRAAVKQAAGNVVDELMRQRDRLIQHGGGLGFGPPKAVFVVKGRCLCGCDADEVSE